MKRTEGFYLVAYVCVAIGLLIMLHYVGKREGFVNPMEILNEKSLNPPEKVEEEVKMVVTKNKPIPEDTGTRLTKLEEDIQVLKGTSSKLKTHQDKQDKKVKDAESSINDAASEIEAVNST